MLSGAGIAGGIEGPSVTARLRLRARGSREVGLRADRVIEPVRGLSMVGEGRTPARLRGFARLKVFAGLRLVFAGLRLVVGLKLVAGLRADREVAVDPRIARPAGLVRSASRESASL
jgi:hypothetical protein